MIKPEVKCGDLKKNNLDKAVEVSDPPGARTLDPLLKREMLYQLS
jgi:hypothetical protein